MEDIIVEVGQAGIALVTLNRSAKRNAVSRGMWLRLGPLFGALGARDDVKVIVLTGAGGHFSAGADISEFAAVRDTPEDIAAYERAGHDAAVGIRDCPKPTIAAVHGFGVGGGCALALACDIRVGDATTRMGIPAAKRGIVYSQIDTALLLRQVGLSRAKLVLYSARIFPAEDCKAMGLIDVLAEAALPAALAEASVLAGNAPLSVAGSKLMLEAMAQGRLQEEAARISAAMHRAATSADYREATLSFIEKRPALFLGQ